MRISQGRPFSILLDPDPASAPAGGAAPAPPADAAGAPASGGLPAAAPVQTNAPSTPSLDWAAAAKMYNVTSEAELYRMLTAPMPDPEPAPRATAPTNQAAAVNMDAILSEVDRRLAQREHSQLVSAQSSVWSADLDRLAGNNADSKAALNYLVNGIVSDIQAKNVYPAGHPLAGTPKPITPDIWASQGKAALDKAYTAMLGAQARTAAGGAPTPLPPSPGSGIPQASDPRNPWSGAAPTRMDLDAIKRQVEQQIQARNGAPMTAAL